MPVEQQLHINCLELIAGSFAVRSFISHSSDCCVLLRMDNVSTVHYSSNFVPAGPSLYRRNTSREKPTSLQPGSPISGGMSATGNCWSRFFAFFLPAEFLSLSTTSSPSGTTSYPVITAGFQTLGLLQRMPLLRRGQLQGLMPFPPFALIPRLLH